jgi:hypothetical protein
VSDNPARRLCTVKPRRRGYRHRDIIVINDAAGFTEHGEIIDDIIEFAMVRDSHIFVTMDPAGLLNIMLRSHGPDFNYQIIESREADVPEGMATMSSARVTRFGWNRMGKGKRKGKAMHIVWSITDMMRDPSKVLNDGSPESMMKFAIDVRDWCKDNNLPIPTALSGIASSLLRDERFYPDARGRIPRATNERMRPLLPGVYSELRAKPSVTHRMAVSLDQRRAYHRAAQSTPMPDSTTLFARGYFNVPDNAPIWAPKGDPVYTRTIAQPGVVLVRALSRPTMPKNETRPPAIDYANVQDVYLWTNEVDLCESTGLDIQGIIAAWTSTNHDEGMPRYGAWAEETIDGASEYRAAWLKPTLHALYGLLAARPRDLRIGHRLGTGARAKYILGLGHTFQVHETRLGAQSSPTVNVPMLGVLQAEIRARTMRLANSLIVEGVDVLHIHADGIHTTGKLPFLSNDWSVEPRTNLRYLDRVSWLADEGDTLPGRDMRARVELRRRLATTLLYSGRG